MSSDCDTKVGAPVREATIYPTQFPILLRERLQGKSVAEVAEFLDVPPEQVNRLLAGHWRPTKGICKKDGPQGCLRPHGTTVATLGGFPRPFAISIACVRVRFRLADTKAPAAAFTKFFPTDHPDLATTPEPGDQFPAPRAWPRW